MLYTYHYGRNLRNKFYNVYGCVSLNDAEVLIYYALHPNLRHTTMLRSVRPSFCLSIHLSVPFYYSVQFARW